MKYVIIGNSAAGIGGVEGIRTEDDSGNITLISEEPYHTYSRPLISYYLAGKVERQQLNYRPPDFYERRRVKAKLGQRAVNIKPEKKQVVLADGSSLNFDKLLIAAGGQPFIPEIPGIAGDNIFTFVKFDQARAVRKYLEEKVDKKSPRAVILGAGLIGLKAAEALIKKGVEVTVVELADRILSRILDKEGSELVQQYLETKGIKFKLNNTIERFVGENSVDKAVLKNGEEISCDLSVIAVGVRPNLDLVEGTEIASNHGILIDNHMQTSTKDIFAAGDVAEGYERLQKRHQVIPIWPNAYNQGLTAGKNMCGNRESYDHNFTRNSIGFFDLPMVTAGVISAEGEDRRKLVKIDKKEGIYKKLVLEEERLIGYIMIKAIDRAGIFTGLIKDKTSVAGMEDELLSENFGFLSFQEEWRRQKLKA